MMPSEVTDCEQTGNNMTADYARKYFGVPGKELFRAHKSRYIKRQ